MRRITTVATGLCLAVAWVGLLAGPAFAQDQEASETPGPPEAQAPAETADDEQGSESTDMIVLGGVELCGPVDEAIAYMDPEPPAGTKEHKRWVKRQEDRRAAVTHSDGSRGYSFDTLPVALSFGGAEPQFASLTVFDDRVLTVVVYWISLDTNVQRRIWEDMRARLVTLKGEPERGETFGALWVEGEKQTGAVWRIRDDNVTLWFSCRPLQRRFEAEKKADTEKALGGIL